MTIGPIIHEFKELGILQLESGKVDTTTEETNTDIYWLRTNFEAAHTGAVYHAEFDDHTIRQFCTILNADPELLDDFLIIQPNIKLLPDIVFVEFSLPVGSKLYKFTVNIPKFTPEGSHAEVIELEQKNKVLIRRIKSLEERIAQQDKNIIMLADICMLFCLRDHYVDEYMPQCIELAGETPYNFDTMLDYIKKNTNKVGSRLLEMIKAGKMPKFKEYIVNKRKELYPYLIGGNSINGSILRDKEYLNRILQFCQLGIEIDNDIIFEGNVIFTEDKYGEWKHVKFSMVEYFNYQVTKFIPWECKCLKNHINESTKLQYQTYYNFVDSEEFSRQCKEIHKLLVALSKK